MAHPPVKAQGLTFSAPAGAVLAPSPATVSAGAGSAPLGAQAAGSPPSAVVSSHAAASAAGSAPGGAAHAAAPVVHAPSAGAGIPPPIGVSPPPVGSPILTAPTLPSVFGASTSAGRPKAVALSFRATGSAETGSPPLTSPTAPAAPTPPPPAAPKPMEDDLKEAIKQEGEDMSKRILAHRSRPRAGLALRPSGPVHLVRYTAARLRELYSACPPHPSVRDHAIRQVVELRAFSASPLVPTPTGTGGGRSRGGGRSAGGGFGGARVMERVAPTQLKRPTEERDVCVRDATFSINIIADSNFAAVMDDVIAAVKRAFALDRAAAANAAATGADPPTPTTVDRIVIKVVERAIEQTLYCDTYARLCAALSATTAGDSGGSAAGGVVGAARGLDAEQAKVLKVSIVNMCQARYHEMRAFLGQPSGAAASPAGSPTMGMAPGTPPIPGAGGDEATITPRQRAVRFIKFCGRLAVQGLISNKLAYRISQELLFGPEKTPGFAPADDVLELLTALLTTTGQKLDYAVATRKVIEATPASMDAIYSRMRELAPVPRPTRRLQFMVEDFCDAAAKWVQRRPKPSPEDGKKDSRGKEADKGEEERKEVVVAAKAGPSADEIRVNEAKELLARLEPRRELAKRIISHDPNLHEDDATLRELNDAYAADAATPEDGRKLAAAMLYELLGTPRKQVPQAELRARSALRFIDNADAYAAAWEWVAPVLVRLEEWEEWHGWTAFAAAAIVQATRATEPFSPFVPLAGVRQLCRECAEHVAAYSDPEERRDKATACATQLAKLARSILTAVKAAEADHRVYHHALAFAVGLGGAAALKLFQDEGAAAGAAGGDKERMKVERRDLFGLLLSRRAAEMVAGPADEVVHTMLDMLVKEGHADTDVEIYVRCHVSLPLCAATLAGAPHREVAAAWAPGLVATLKRNADHAATARDELDMVALGLGLAPDVKAAVQAVFQL